MYWSCITAQRIVAVVLHCMKKMREKYSNGDYSNSKSAWFCIIKNLAEYKNLPIFDTVKWIFRFGMTCRFWSKRMLRRVRGLTLFQISVCIASGVLGGVYIWNPLFKVLNCCSYSSLCIIKDVSCIRVVSIDLIAAQKSCFSYIRTC